MKTEIKSLTRLGPLVIDGAEISIAPDFAVRFKGVMTLRTPAKDVIPYLQQVHQGAMADGRSEVRVDVGELGFINSSSICIFINWADWITAEPRSRRYSLNFLINPGISWQETTFNAVRALNDEVVRVTRQATSGTFGITRSGS